MRRCHERLGALAALAFTAVLAACQPTKASPSSSPSIVTDSPAVPSAPAPAVPRGEAFTVSRVVDGDTFKAEELAAEGAASDSVRLWGIDAPERGNEPAGPDATAWLRVVVEDADRRLYSERQDVDRYGRTVARCYTPDGQDVQAEMIAAGHALEWCRYSRGAFGQCGRPGGRTK